MCPTEKVLVSVLESSEELGAPVKLYSKGEAHQVPVSGAPDIHTRNLVGPQFGSSDDALESWC